VRAVRAVTFVLPRVPYVRIESVARQLLAF